MPPEGCGLSVKVMLPFGQGVLPPHPLVTMSARVVAPGAAVGQVACAATDHIAPRMIRSDFTQMVRARFGRYVIPVLVASEVLAACARRMCGEGRIESERVT